MTDTEGKSLYRRVLLKLSGEALAGQKGYGICSETIGRVCQDVKEAYDLGTEIGIVLGAGNIFRGVAGASQGIDRATSDYMGMLATIINALALQNALEKTGIPTRVMAAIPVATLCETYIRRRAMRHMEKGRIVIYAAGTGNPFFTTDTAAALRSIEIGADILMKATKVDGIYSDDPKTSDDARLIKRIDYREVLQRRLQVMDSTAVSLCMDNNLPILTFNLTKKGSIKQAFTDRTIGTMIDSKGGCDYA